MAKNRETKARPQQLPARTPKAAIPSGSSQQETPLFCFRHADRSTGHPWKFDPDAGEAPGLFGFMCDIGTNTWAEIEAMQTGGFGNRHRKHHAQSVGLIRSEAQNDLIRRKLDEIFGDDIFRFRLSGERRLWGFRVGRSFHVIWWDPRHQVYETEPN